MSENFTIPNPCAKNWSDLQGEGRERFCGACKTHVHFIANYSPSEWKKLWGNSNGHVCGFLGDSPPPPRRRRTILVGALLTAVSPLFAASGRVKFRVIEPTGGPLPKASIAVLNSEDKAVQCIETDQFGEAVLTGLPLGDSRFAVTSPGFERRRLTLTFTNRKEVKVEVHLWVSTIRIGIVVEVELKPKKHDGWLQY